MAKNLFPKLCVNIITVLVLLLSAQTSFAQGTGKSVVTLKSGEQVKGTITEAVPDHYIKIQLPDGTIKKINASDIDKIESDEVKKQASIGLSIIGGVFAGYDLTSGLNYVIVNPNVIIGLKVNQQRFGLGLGFIYGQSMNFTQPNSYNNYISSTSSQNLYYFPVSLNYHGEFGKKKVMPSADVSIGYPLNLLKENTYYSYQNSGYNDDFVVNQVGLVCAQLSPGVSFRVSKKVLINIAATFNLLVFKENNQEKDYIIGTTVLPTTTNISSTIRVLSAVGGSLNIIY